MSNRPSAPAVPVAAPAPASSAEAASLPRPPGPRALAADQTAARLVGVARRAFAEHGFAQVSLEALAAEAGVTRGALHHHFTNKAGLFEAVFRAVDAEISAELEQVYAAEPDAWRAFRACFHAYLDLALRPDRARILFQDAPAVLGLRSAEILMQSGFAQILEDLTQLMGSGRILALHPEALAHLLNGAVLAQVAWLAGTPAGSKAQHDAAHRVLDAVFDGLTLPGPTRPGA